MHLVMLETEGTVMKEAFRRPPTNSFCLLKWLTRIKQWHSLCTDSCSVLHTDNNIIPPTPLFIHSFKWQLWVVKIKLQKVYRFQRKSEFSYFITSMLTSTEISYSYSWSRNKTIDGSNCCRWVWKAVRNMDLSKKLAPKLCSDSHG